jgi:isocitrate/isopropylmalate dehydrogenase
LPFIYEPAGGTAPDIAGKNLANPITAGKCTGDVFSTSETGVKRVGTGEMGDAIAAAV